MAEISGGDLRKAFVAATGCLERYRDAINALNVFPVPDGDTGTNMLLTMRSSLDRCPDSPDPGVEEVLSGLAEGAFWGARGNSGVILSQLFRGFAEAHREPLASLDPWLVHGLHLATEAVYQAVVQPVEGTMLSVIKASSIKVSGKASSSRERDRDTGRKDHALWETAFNAAVEAVYATPSQLPLLREAGVVDAGGLGVAVILGAAYCSLTSQDLDLVDQALGPCCVQPVNPAAAQQQTHQSGLDSGFLAASLEENWGYCIQYIIDGSSTGDGSDLAADLTVEMVRNELGAELAGSAVVVVDGRYFKVHVHAPDPGPALSCGAALGQLDRISVENMGLQNTHFVDGHRAFGDTGTRLAVVAVAQGEGLGHLFRDAGGSGIIDGGQTMNPSVGQILDYAAALSAAKVIVLPNNPNVLAAANQAAAKDSRLHVVPSTSIPQGVAALLAFSPEELLEHNLESMSAALADVTSIEVTKAARSTDIGGVTVHEGQCIVMIEGELVAAAPSPESALQVALDRTVNSAGQVVTIYQGGDAEPGAVQALVSELEEGFPGIQVDLVDGGQPHYPYLASVE